MNLRTLCIASSVAAGCWSLMGQSGPITNHVGYTFPAPVTLAPGQIVTVFVTGIPIGTYQRAPAGQDLVTSVAGVTVGMSQYTGRGIHVFRLPILEVRSLGTCLLVLLPSCAPPMAAVTVQVPFEMETFELCPNCDVTEPSFGVRVNDVSMSVMDVLPYPDQVHIVRAFDSVMPIGTKDREGYCFKSAKFDNLAPQNLTGLPCPAIVKRADGTLVSAANPAQAGEELTAVAVGLGHTWPLAETGKVVKEPAGAAMQFTMDFNYRPNALATKPRPADAPGVPMPVYVASMKGEVGLYEVRFVVPPVPAGTPPCASLEGINGFPRENVVYSNLTFSLGGQFSFDGAGICVAVEEGTR